MVKKAVIVGLLLVMAMSSVGLGKEIVVTSPADSGTGSFRWALETAQSGDTITFDPEVFSPGDPATIHLQSCLPSIWQGRITVDASDVGLILNGQALPPDDAWGVEISSDGNAIYGLQVVNVPGPGIVIVEGASDNTIGGDRTVGRGPIGHANLCSGNNGGICMWGEGPSHNTIIGNLIGTDISGTKPFGNVDGIFLSEGACFNSIGPGNVIAYNDEHAIVIQGSNSFGNTITQNSIHDNGWGGIKALEGGNRELPSPLITSFDVISGKVTGTACTDCTVEFFSEEVSWEDCECEEVHRTSSEGKIYEGCAKATHVGTFSFDKGSPFIYLHLTATATDADGNTSEFSLATSETTRSWVIQVRNEQPMYRLSREQAPRHEYNRIGSMWAVLDSAQMEDVEWLLDNIDSLGLMWVKYYIDVPDWHEVGVFEGYSDGNVTHAQDEFVNRVVERGGKIVLGLVFWDESVNARIAEWGEGYSRYETEEEIQAYLAHVQSLVHHFKGRIEYYELLNEQNVGKGTQQYVAVEHYINLIKRVTPIIRRGDPQAKIVVGTIPFDAEVGQEKEATEYFFTLLRSDAMPLVDAVSWHPFFGASPADPVSQDYYYAYPDLVQQIKNVASSHGFTGEYLATEMSWLTPLSDPYFVGPGPTHSVFQAAKYYARMITLHLGMNITTGIGGEGFDLTPPIVSVVRTLCTLMAGHEAIDMPVKIEIDYEPVSYCSFRYPNGDRMLAIWTDGVAQDEDPGTPATITFPGLTAGAVTGIDVLHGFEQELVYEKDGNDTVIRDLLVKDYPILIKLSGITMGPDYEETVGDGFHRLGDVDAVPSSAGSSSDRDGDGVPDAEDYCPDWPGSKEANGC